MRYLVTGAKGFIGSYTVESLLRGGHEVVALDRSTTWAKPPETNEGGGLVDVVGDVSDFSLLADLFASHDIERVIHLAAELHDRSATQRGQCIQSNVVGTYNVLEAARLFGRASVVVASSAALYGTIDDQPVFPIPDDARLFAGDVYEASKVFGETIGTYYATRLGVPNTSLRVGLAYGGRCLIGTARRLIDELVIKPLSGRPGRLEYTADTMMNFLYVPDAAEAFVAASGDTAMTGHAYNIRGDYRSVADAIDIVRSLLPGADVEPGTAAHRWPMDFDDAPFRRDFGFTCRWTLEDALADIVRESRSAPALPSEPSGATP